MTIQSFSESYSPEWVIEGVIARAQRPGYPLNRPCIETVDQWTAEVLEMGIRSVLCIIDSAQLKYYQEIGLPDETLFDYYQRVGLAVSHIDARDYKTPPLSTDELNLVWDEFNRLDKPIIVHCSAGRDRTGAALSHIISKLGSPKK